MKNVLRISVKSFCLLLLFTQFNVQAQETASLNVNTLEISQKTNIPEEYTIKGIVIDEENTPLIGVNILLKGTDEGIVTDLDGKFEFPRALKANDVLIFSYIGYDSQEYVVVENESETVAITITFDLSQISLMGAVEVDGVYSSKRNIFQKIGDLFRK